jgi:hypothetical protein
MTSFLQWFKSTNQHIHFNVFHWEVQSLEVTHRFKNFKKKIGGASRASFSRSTVPVPFSSWITLTHEFTLWLFNIAMV